MARYLAISLGLTRSELAGMLLVALLLPALLGCPASREPLANQPPSSSDLAPSASSSLSNDTGTNSDPTPPSQASVQPASESSTQALFDGSTLDGWKVTSFGGEGECRVEDGALVLEPGFPLTGLTSTREDLPSTHYELSLEARKTRGIDFFCGLTFPVEDAHCSLIVGGWAGSVVGLSLLDDQDANHNETRRLKKFELGQWYRIKLRVTPQRIMAWIDDEQMVDQDISGRRLSVRNETLPSRPLGICSFETQAEFRNFVLKKLVSEE